MYKIHVCTMCQKTMILYNESDGNTFQCGINQYCNIPAGLIFI